jgi:hypothetical protein
MAVARKGLRTIQVGEEKFVWRVRKNVSHEEKHGAQLAIPIQYLQGGQLLIAYLGYSRSGYEAHGIEGAGILNEITPAAIREYIVKAIRLGWQYKTSGKPVSIINNALAADVLVARLLGASS